MVMSSRGEPRARCRSARINLIILLMSYEHSAPTLLVQLQVPAAHLVTSRRLRIVPRAKTCLGVF